MSLAFLCGVVELREVEHRILYELNMMGITFEQSAITDRVAFYILRIDYYICYFEGKVCKCVAICFAANITLKRHVPILLTHYWHYVSIFYVVFTI